MKKTLIAFGILGLSLLTACKKDKDCNEMPEPTAQGLVVPTTYEFMDANGNNTVSFNGQAQRLEMLGEMATYMKTADIPGTVLDAQVLKDMYGNIDFTWTDGPTLGMTGSTKQLKNKTAAAPTGVPDPGVQAYFEAYMEQIAELSATTIAGETSGSLGNGGVVLSSTDASKQYLQSAEGVEFAQIIEKGLMGAVFYNQITQNYLGESELSGDNTTAVDPDNGKFYTDMEHAWDEAYGYFTTEINYTPGGAGTDRFWGKYVDGSRELHLGTATKISEAFRRGRAAITAKDLAERDEQVAVIRTELQRAVAGTAIHYLNGTIANFGDDALRNHQLSEAIAFISCLPYGHNPIANQQEITGWFIMIGTNHYNVTISDLTTVRDLIATEAGLFEHKDHL